MSRSRHVARCTDICHPLFFCVLARPLLKRTNLRPQEYTREVAYIAIVIVLPKSTYYGGGRKQSILANGVRVLSNEYTCFSQSRMLAGERHCCCCCCYCGYCCHCRGCCYLCCCCCYWCGCRCYCCYCSTADNVVAWFSVVSVPTATTCQKRLTHVTARRHG